MIQTVTQIEIDRWPHENQCTYGNLALKREDKPVKSKASPEKRHIKPPWYQRDPEDWFKPIFRVLVWMHDHLLDIAKMTIACAIGVALGLMFVWAW